MGQKKINMSDKIEYSRLLLKRTTTSGETPTISTGTTLNDLVPTDLLLGEMYSNMVDDRVWLRTSNGLLEFTTGSGGALTGSTNGLTDNGSVVELGGTLTRDTTIDPNLNRFKVEDVSNVIEYLNFYQDELNIGGNNIGDLNIDGLQTIIYGASIAALLSDGTITVRSQNGLDKTTTNYGNGYVVTTTEDSSSNVTFNQSPTEYRIGSSFTGFTGAKYDSDYSSNYTNRSLVDKEYVDGLVNGTVSVELEIGDWNMDSTSATTVSHGLTATEWKTVRNVSLMIRNDADTEYYTVDSSAPTTGGGFVNVLLDKLDSTNFNLYRLDLGSFDSGSFSATTYNRGWVNFTYKPD